MESLEFFNMCDEVANDISDQEHVDSYTSSLNIPSFVYTGEIPQEVPMGSMFFDADSDAIMVRTESGFVQVEGGDMEWNNPIEEQSYEMWYPPIINCPNVPDVIYLNNSKYKHLDELYVAEEVRKAKKLGYLILEAIKDYVIADHPINIKYLEWCKRSNIPYLIAYEYLSAYKIELNLNPRGDYTKKIFNYDIHYNFVEWFFRQEYFNTRLWYDGGRYEITHLTSSEVFNVLNEIVDLYRDSDNLGIA